MKLAKCSMEYFKGLVESDFAVYLIDEGAVEA